MNARTNIASIAKEVKTLHDQDEALSKARRQTKVQQRDLRLRVGTLVNSVQAGDLAFIAEQSGYPVARLRDFGMVRTAWPEGSFPADLSYTPLEELARDPDRFTKVASGMSKRDARAARGGRVDTPSRWSTQTKAEYVAEVLKDPDVARQVSDAVMEAEIAADAAAYQRLRGAEPASADNIDTVGRLASQAHAIARKIDAWTEDARDLTVSEGDKDYLLGAVEQMLIAAQTAQAHIEATDAAFAALLEEEWKNR